MSARPAAKRSALRMASVLVLCGSACGAVFGSSTVRADGTPDASAKPALKALADAVSPAARATDLTVELEFDKARAELAKADPNDPAVILAKARLALYEEDCDLTVALLGRPELAPGDEARLVADVGRGCARVTAATVVDKDEESGVVIRWQDDADRALRPLLVDTVLKARTSLSKDLGVAWKKPTRITVVRDLHSLSAMTGLPYKSAQTTGTVAVAKWGRVTILSPRASNHGFSFRDTLTHELTHLAISMQTRDRAPLWLHEGVARREEVRWREPGLFDDRPPPESIVLRGMEMKLDLPLDKLGPSIAMLPSAEAATVAFAEVTSFVRFFAESSPPDALARFLLALRDASSADEALKSVSGETLAQWDVKWRAALAKRPKEPLSPLLGLGASPPGLADSRERARLAELLLGRGHPSEALTQLDKLAPDLLGDPSLRYLRARVLEADGKVPQADALLEDPKQWVASYGPCWAMRGRLARARGDDATADASFAEAVAQDPFSVEAACQVLPGAPSKPGDAPSQTGAANASSASSGGDAVHGNDPNGGGNGGVDGGSPAATSSSTSSKDAASSSLCEAARKRLEPDLGRD